LHVALSLLSALGLEAVRVPSRKGRRETQSLTQNIAQNVTQNVAGGDDCITCLEHGGGAGCLDRCRGKSSECKSCCEYGGGTGCIPRCCRSGADDDCVTCLEYGGGDGCLGRCTQKSSECQNCLQYGGGSGCLPRCCSSGGGGGGGGGSCRNLYSGTQGSRETFLINRMSYSGSEAAQFMGQCAHECDSFKTMEEYASGDAYEGRKDLGNTRPGDGRRYKGRGFIQITGRYNYRTFGGYIGVDLENNPKRAAEPDIAAQVAIQYWNRRVKPYVSNFGDTRAVTRRINGGTNGLQDRINKFNKYTSLCD